jgi:hypothetical protein
VVSAQCVINGTCGKGSLLDRECGMVEKHMMDTWGIKIELLRGIRCKFFKA